MLGPRANQDENYRRGVVLGLTLGEAILLVLFSLLLAFAALFNQQLKEAEVQAAEVERLKLVAVASQSFVEKFSDPRKYPGGATIEDITKEYVAIQVKSEEQRKKIISVEQKLKEAESKESEKINELKKKEKQLNQEKLAAEARAKEESRKRKDAEKKQKTAESKLTDSDKLKNLLEAEKERADSAEEKLRVANNKIRNLDRKFGSGKGTEKPSCWSVETGKRKGAEEYIFDVAVLPNGYILRDRKLLHRIEDQKKLPLSKIRFEKLISNAEYLSQLRPLFEWSEKHDCRFFVAAFDNIPQDQKDIFKKQIDIMGERVYHYRYRQDKFPLNIDNIIGGQTSGKSPENVLPMRMPDKVEEIKNNPGVRTTDGSSVAKPTRIPPKTTPKPPETKKTKKVPAKIETPPTKSGDESEPGNVGKRPSDEKGTDPISAFFKFIQKEINKETPIN
jgi:hypothetical protein